MHDEYERVRQKKILHNNELLERLRLDAIHAGIIQEPRPAPRKVRRNAKHDKVNGPLCQSARIAERGFLSNVDARADVPAIAARQERREEFQRWSVEERIYMLRLHRDHSELSRSDRCQLHNETFWSGKLVRTTATFAQNFYLVMGNFRFEAADAINDKVEMLLAG